MAETKAIKKVGDGINLELDGISGGGGGVEIKTLEATVTLAAVSAGTLMGGITSTVPDNVNINTLIGVYEVTDTESNSFIPFPDTRASYVDGDLSMERLISYTYIQEIPPGAESMYPPLGFLFTGFDTSINSGGSLTFQILIVYI